MLVLHGSAISNYYNKVKLALLEKGVPFEKIRELTTFIDWHLEIVARQLYGGAFFGAALQAAGIDHRGYGKLIAERPTAQKVAADRKAAQAKL